MATAWMTALSATFPRGEAFFIESVKAFRNSAPPQLEAEIRAFIRQEINHSREHIALNRAAETAGYDLSQIDGRVEQLLAKARNCPPILGLATTMALEHFTAMFSHLLLTEQRLLAGAESETADLWRWHAVEEIEHKAVAYDTWLHATRDWGRWKRWKVKALVMLQVTSNFLRNRVRDSLELMEQDGITGWRAKLSLFSYLWAKPGMLRKILPMWLSYFRPGFHPWKHDDRDLIGKYDSEYAAAVLPAE